MLIITGTVITVSTNNLKTKNLSNLYADLKSLDDKIAVYYNKYGTLPLKEKFTGSYDFTSVANPNDNPEEYYIIDVNKLESLILTKKLTWTENDVYIINTKTHTVYYPEGVTQDGEKFYRLPGEYSRIDVDYIQVIANIESLTITKGDTHEIDAYFTYKSFGTSGIKSVKYLDTSNGNTSVINTNTLEIGSHIIKCVVTNTNGKEFSATLLVIVNKKEESQPEYVAKIGEQYYTTLQSAVDAVPNDNTETVVELLTSVSEDINVVQNKNIILELHQNTVNNISNSTIMLYGKINIQNGTINSSNTNCIYNEGTLSISSGANIVSNGAVGIVNKSTANMTLLGGNISSIGESAINNQGILTIYNGEIYSDDNWVIVNESAGKTEFYGGNISSAQERGISNDGKVLVYDVNLNAGIANNASAELEMQGGSINVNNANAISNIGKVNILDGIIESSEKPAIYNLENGSMIITGGNISSENGNAIINTGTTNISGTVTITNNSTSFPTVYNNIGGILLIQGGTLTSSNCRVIENEAELEIGENANIIKTTGNIENEYEAILNDSGASLIITGGSITTEDVTSIANKGDMTINGEVTIEKTSEGAGYYCIENYTTGVLNVTSGRIETMSCAIGNMGEATIGGDTSIVGNSTQKVLISNAMGSLIINGGTMTSQITNIINNNANLEITGNAKLISNSNENNPAIANSDSGNLTISGGTITSQNANAIYNSALITITNGEIISNSSENPAVDNRNSGEIMITGGSITSLENTIENIGTGKVTISGGTFTSETAHIINNLANLEISQNVNFVSNIADQNLPAIFNNTNGNMKISGGNFTLKYATGIYNIATMSILDSINIVTNSPNNEGIRNAETGNLTISAPVNFEGNTNVLYNYGILEMNEGAVFTAGGVGSPLVNCSGATATITGGTIQGKTTNAISNTGTLEITGMVNISGEGETIPTIYNFTSTSDIPTKLTIKAGNINSTKSMAVYGQEKVEIIISGTANLTNSIAGQPVVYSAGILIANGGTIKSGNTNAIFNVGTATINGTAYLETSGASYPTIYNRGTLTVGGGTIKNTASGGYAIYNNGGTSTVNGGSITGTVR